MPLSGPFDITLKHLIEAHPEDWLRLVGVSATGPVELIDADLSTVSAEADKLLRLAGPSPWLLHLEFQTTYENNLPERIHWYNALAGYRHGLPVRSVVILMRPQADGPAMTGELRRNTPDRSAADPYLVFRYDVIRVWQLDSEDILENGLGTLPLAILTDDATQRPAEIVDRMKQRVRREGERSEIGTFWTATYSLMGLRYTSAVAEGLLRGVRTMKDSVTYQAIVEEGRELGRSEKAREGIIQAGTRLLGRAPSARTRAKLRSIKDEAVLQSLFERVFEVKKWDELFR